MSVLHIFLFLSLLYHHGLLASAQAQPKILTKQGYVRGIQETVQLHKGQPHTVHKFLGIPYAKSPTNNLRFKPPQPLKNSLSKYDYNATSYRPICVQYLGNDSYILSIKLAWPGFNSSTDMSEDCLYLNIYTPSKKCTTNKYPVLVHIHGGSYFAGTPIRDVSPGEYLPRHDVVLVTIQYRLGVFGFFTTGDSEAPGNLGFLDQIEALKWIQNNIDMFCGDKDSVTLLGESAGGSSVSLHYLSPLSEGKFHRGIAVSGVALAPFAFKRKSTVLKASKTLIKNAGCVTVQCLRNKSMDAIVKHNTVYYNMQPFVDNYFLPDEPIKLLLEGKFQKSLPLMSGFVSNEGTNAMKSKPEIRTIPAYQNYLYKTFFKPWLNFTKQQAPCAFDALAFQYTPCDDLENPEAYTKNVIDMLSDYVVIAPTHDVLSFHSHHGVKPYMFEFAHRSLHHPKKDWKGVAHEDTTAYKFGLPLLKSTKTNLKFDDNDRSVSEKMVTLFTNFAKSGNPNALSTVSGDQWTAFDASKERKYLIINASPSMASKYHSQRMMFWNKYFPTLFPCKERTSKSWYGRCKKSDAPRPSQSPNGESSPATSVRGAPNQDGVLW